MWILMVEAGVALFLLVFIVWWTMYQDKAPEDQGQAAPPAVEKQDPPESLGN